MKGQGSLVCRMHLTMRFSESAKTHHPKFREWPAIRLYIYYESTQQRPSAKIQWFFTSVTNHTSVDQLWGNKGSWWRGKSHSSRNKAICSARGFAAMHPCAITVLSQQTGWYIPWHHSLFLQGQVQLLFITFWWDIFNSLRKTEGNNFVTFSLSCVVTFGTLKKERTLFLRA